MKPAALQIQANFEQAMSIDQVNLSENVPVNHALFVVAQEVAALLKVPPSFLKESMDQAEIISSLQPKTIRIRAMETEYRQVMAIEPLTARQLEVLQEMVDGHSNLVIAENLFISLGTVKTHVRNILQKLYVSDRTQAAVCALRSGLVH